MAADVAGHVRNARQEASIVLAAGGTCAAMSGALRKKPDLAARAEANSQGPRTAKPMGRSKPRSNVDMRPSWARIAMSLPAW